MMKETNGLMLTEEIRSCDKQEHTKVIVLTSIGKRGDAIKTQSKDFYVSLTKPIKQMQLYDGIIKALGLETLSVKSSEESRNITQTLLKENNSFRILLAEDNVVNQKLVLKILKKYGFNANSVFNGKEAIDALKTIPYDMVLMDIQMPEMGGLEATRLIRDQKTDLPNPDIPIIAMTARAMKGDKEKCLQAGMDDYISKPINTEKMLSIIDDYLKNPHQ